MVPQIWGSSEFYGGSGFDLSESAGYSINDLDLVVDAIQEAYIRQPAAVSDDAAE